ncbi:MAG: hypothetical protein GY771_10530 [bacterium]|nr:hypothetical protein [bacterium]
MTPPTLRAIFAAMNQTGDNSGECYHHKGRRAIAACSNCGAYLCPECVSESLQTDGGLVCPVCRKSSGAQHIVAPKWEAETKRPGIREFLLTWRDAVFGGRLFFGAFPARGPIARPLVFAAICVAIGFLGSIPSSLQMLGSMGAMFDATMLATGFAAALVTAPFVYAALFILTVVYLYLLARGLGGSGDFKATLRVVSYAQVGAVAEIIPIVGNALSLAMRLIMYTRGVSAIHKFRPWQSIVLSLIVAGTALGAFYLLYRIFQAFAPMGF